MYCQLYKQARNLEIQESDKPVAARGGNNLKGLLNFLRILVYLVIYDSGNVSFEQILLSWYSQKLRP